MNNRKQLVEKLKEDTLIKYLIEKEVKFKLSAKTVMDILNGVEEEDKEYTFISIYNSKIKKELLIPGHYVDKYRIDNKFHIEELKIEQKDFTISSGYFINKSVGFEEDSFRQELYLDFESYESKVLIPKMYSPVISWNCLKNYKEWERRGFILRDDTYYDLLESLKK